jgi:glycosyltransferase involved in cell wall biosynthesis
MRGQSCHRPLRVLILMDVAEQRGGAENVLLDLLRHGRDQGVEWLVVFLCDGPMVQQARSLGVQTWLVCRGRLRHLTRYIATVRAISGIARRERVDFVLSWMWMNHYYGSPAAGLAGRPAGWFEQENGNNGGLVRRIATILPAQALITTTRSTQTALERSRPRRVVAQVYPGVDLSRFDPATLPPPGQARRDVGIGDDGPVVGIVGRLQRWKGMHILMQAMPRILCEHPRARCVIVGGRHDLEPGYEGELRSEAAALGIADRVTFAGLQSNVPLWMQAMDVVVHASDREPFGIVVLEAMALGKPVVAGAAGGPAEIIADGINGLLVPYGRADLLADQVLRCLGDGQFGLGIGTVARQRALEFSSAAFAEKFARTLRTLINSNETRKGDEGP